MHISSKPPENLRSIEPAITPLVKLTTLDDPMHIHAHLFEMCMKHMKLEGVIISTFRNWMGYHPYHVLL